ncbi:MAG: ATP-binding cassette domain-containing protein [Phycisphaeraceae bacterium]|nr:ATP-binding cassette domain-containing protein [Phycisphaeraceae bacterium]
MSDAIIIENVTKTFGPKVAVEDLSLRVEEGGLYGFIGPNGAGKTTTIRMIMSIIFPDSGRLSVLGRASAVESKDRIGYLPEERGVYRKMKVGSFLSYMARLKGADPGPALTTRIKDWLERVGLADVLNKRCEELSKGMQQKVQFLSCILHEPDLLIFDEPFTGLDPVNMRLMRDLFLEQHQRGATIIFSTHVMQQAEQLCDHIVMIDSGRKVLDDSKEEIYQQFDPRTLEFEPVDASADSEPIRALPGVDVLEADNHVWRAHIAAAAEPDAILREAVNLIPMRRAELKRIALEDVFISIVAAREGKSEIELREQIHHNEANLERAER